MFSNAAPFLMRNDHENKNIVYVLVHNKLKNIS